MNNHTHQRGFTLLEVLIAFIVLTIGLLGTVALQAKAKQASYDSVQRAAALALANDIVQRVRTNDSPSAATDYDVNFGSTSTSTAASCFNARCTAAQMAAFDISEWIKATQARERTGALSDAFVCIDPTDNVDGTVSLQIIVSWQGRQKISQSSANKAITCGTGDNRRMVVMNTDINLRDGTL